MVTKSRFTDPASRFFVDVAIEPVAGESLPNQARTENLELVEAEAEADAPPDDTKGPQMQTLEDKKNNGIKESALAAIDALGAADKDTFDSYQYVLELRKAEMLQSTKTRYAKIKDEKDKKTYASKCFSLLKALVIYGIVLGIVALIAVKRYEELQKTQEAAENIHETVTMPKEPMTPEEIKKAAMEEE